MKTIKQITIQQETETSPSKESITEEESVVFEENSSIKFEEEVQRQNLYILDLENQLINMKVKHSKQEKIIGSQSEKAGEDNQFR